MSDLRCQVCDTTITNVEKIEGPMNSCPACGTKLLPVWPEDDVTVTVNWNTLRGFVIWAEMWAQHATRKDPEQNADMLKLVYAQAKRLQAQHPERTPLTFAGEMAQLREHFPSAEVHGFDETPYEAQQAADEAERIVGEQPEAT